MTDGRFRGGWITRRCGNPPVNIHAVQMELAMHGYLVEPAGTLNRANWPAPLDAELGERLTEVLRNILLACLAFTRTRGITT